MRAPVSMGFRIEWKEDSLPRPAPTHYRANEILTRYRLEIAALGTAAFVAVLVALLLG